MNHGGGGDERAQNIRNKFNCSKIDLKSILNAAMAHTHSHSLLCSQTRERRKQRQRELFDFVVISLPQLPLFCPLYLFCSDLPLPLALFNCFELNFISSILN